MTDKSFNTLVVSLLGVFTLFTFPANAQLPGFGFCSAGVRGDGFIDWTQLPAPPTPSRNGPNDPVDVTVPVIGIPGLAATIHIPVANMTPGQPLYTVLDSTDLTLSLQDGASPITLTFNQPVRGVRAVVRVRGRFEYRANVTVSNPPGGPPAAAVDVSGFDFPGFQTKVIPLNLLSRNSDLTTLSFSGEGGEWPYFELINLRVQSDQFDLAKNVPADGLQQWLRADEGTYVPLLALPPKISSLSDRSGNGNDASSADVNLDPMLDYDGGHCTPVAVFTGRERLVANLPISGWAEMTVIMAAESSSDTSESPQYGENAAISWQEDQSWGETFFTPLQSSVYFRFGTTQPDNMPRYPRPLTIGGDFSITTAVHSGGIDSLYVNGQRVLRQPGGYSELFGTGSVETIGAGFNNTFFTGKIGEILIYNRALTQREREAVEHYLKAKFGVL